MIARAAASADAAPGHTLFNRGVRDLDIDHAVDLNAHLIQRLGLRHSAREAVEDESVFAVIRGKALLDDADDHIVRDQRAAFHIGFCAQSHFRPIPERLADNVARADRGDAETLADDFRLGAFAGAGSAEEYQFHIDVSFTLRSPCNDASSFAIRAA